MIAKKLANTIKKRLVETYHPLAIYLFGSHAWGEPTADSDIDLMVIMPDNTELESPESYRGYLALADLEVSKDLIVIRENVFLKRAAHPSTLQHKILNEGIKLYGNL